MSRCFTWFPIGGLGEPNIYHDSGVFYKEVGVTWWYFWGVFVLEGGLLVFLTNFIRHKFTYRFWFGIFPLIWWSKI